MTKCPYIPRDNQLVLPPTLALKLELLHHLYELVLPYRIRISLNPSKMGGHLEASAHRILVPTQHHLRLP